MSTHTPTHTSGCDCDDCTPVKRNRFFRGKSMRAEEFRLEQTYAIERRRLLNRAIAGWGVVYGLSVKQEDPPEPTKFVVGPGLALDRHGRELELRAPAVLGPGNTFIVQNGYGQCRVQSLESVERNREYLLKIHYAERRFGDVPSPDDCGGCDEPEKKYVCEDVAFSLTLLEPDKCPCGDRDCDRSCSCCQPPTSDKKSCGCRGRGPHACLCEWTTNTTGPEHDGTLCEWKCYWLDPKDGVALACVRVWTTEDKCHPFAMEVTNACDPRRIVKSNDLLYDLLRGCDLTRISDVSWRDWHRSGELVEWKDFADMFTVADDGTKHPPVKSEFVVTFSGPVLEDTIRRDAVVMTAITMDPGSGWRIPRRIPIARIDKTPSRPMPKEFTDQIRLYVDHGWYMDEVDKAAHSWFTRGAFAIEIEIRGDLILDCHCQAVDANAVGLAAAPTGNGSPGGTYLSSFWVKRRRTDDHYKDEEIA